MTLGALFSNIKLVIPICQSGNREYLFKFDIDNQPPWKFEHTVVRVLCGIRKKALIANLWGRTTERLRDKVLGALLYLTKVIRYPLEISGALNCV